MYTSLLIISINPFIILGGNIMLRKSMTSILSCIIAVAIGVNLLGSIVNASTNGHSRDDAYSWAKSRLTNLWIMMVFMVVNVLI